MGEFTVPTLSSLNPDIHVKPAYTYVERDCNNLKMRIFYLPRTRMSREGEDASFAKQNGPSNSEAEAAIMHRKQPPAGSAIFVYCHKSS
ncbi:hypothetical protein K503DRAFT_746848 [Rhizopogon vinicolor AM-OR11-026]|uniref:Uncharacterized protein n=1 Tax=Rhizopogon vinicolor AM-OR11-026 TaxID=1314800 RepID=A0A1B7MQD1_9AGAM|nr:hypothetical protein K503DRAFT_746848 [Rhizopogon vinicolor AM-OR11-026]